MRVPSARTKRRSLEAAAVGLFAASLTGLAGYVITDQRDPRPVGWVSPQPVAPGAQEEQVPEARPKEGARQEPRVHAAAEPRDVVGATGSDRAPLAGQQVPPMLDKRAAGDRAERKKPCFKGVATWAYPKSKASIKNSRACWFYGWGPDRAGIAAPAGVEFVPMIHRAATIDDVAKVKGRGYRYLLGFNEPDLGDQANMSVEQALDLWPRLVRTGLILGSPSVATGGELPGGWLDRFMKGAKKRKLRVDFITLHWYGADFRAKPAALQLRSYLRKVHKRYKKPIWLTEFALTDFTRGAPRYPSQKQQAAFLRQAAKMLRGEPYVKRYAWFALPTDRSGTGLYDPDGSPTPAGRAFRSAPRYK
ncbi:glycoside hydrolase family protein [Actinocorallia populi]|uniref:glycoside hydrolase family protein n=1 Tax=Actinocorallia populi TaxID=2079200 RepID=UPI0018E5000E|nr:glycoside hydrolase family protein [Actinocorallia populi]